MGSGKSESSAKAPKTNVTQEQAPTISSAVASSVYPDWSNFQAYPPVPPQGFYHPPVGSSPQAHPYMWGVQHLIPPYGSPPPPYLMYPPRGLYAHPSIPPGSYPFGSYAMTTPNANVENSGTFHGGMELDNKVSKGKKRHSIRRSGSSNMLSGKNNTEPSKVSGTPTTEVSRSDSSNSSSEESDANSQNDSQPKSAGRESFDAPPLAMVNQAMAIIPMSAASAPGVGGPPANLNIGMEYWAPSSLSPIPTLHPMTTVGAGPGGPSEHLFQDERERKRQRRKQSNREAARRSRMRKQAEFDELAHRAEILNEENTSLRMELDRIKLEYQQLLSKYNSLEAKLGVQQEMEEPDSERKEQPLEKENPK